MAKLGRVKAGDPITDGLFNAIMEVIDRFRNLDVASGPGYLRLDSHPKLGKTLSLEAPSPVQAILSGSTSPYSWQEVEATPGGGSATFGSQRSGTNDAHEYNARPALAGRVVELSWTSAADWRFQHVAHPCPWLFVVRRCNASAFASATVNLSQSGVLIKSGVTNGSGLLTLSVPAGTYDVEIVPPAGSGHDTYSAAIAHVCNQTSTLQLSVDVDHQCSGSCPCVAMPNDIDIAFAFGGGYTGPPWADASLTFSNPGPGQAGWYSPVMPHPTTAGHDVQYLVQCTSSLTQRLDLKVFDVTANTTPATGAMFYPAVVCNPFSGTSGSLGAFSLANASWSLLG